MPGVGDVAVRGHRHQRTGVRIDAEAERHDGAHLRAGAQATSLLEIGNGVDVQLVEGMVLERHLANLLLDLADPEEAAPAPARNLVLDGGAHLGQAEARRHCQQSRRAEPDRRPRRGASRHARQRNLPQQARHAVAIPQVDVAPLRHQQRARGETARRREHAAVGAEVVHDLLQLQQRVLVHRLLVRLRLDDDADHLERRHQLGVDIHLVLGPRAAGQAHVVQRAVAVRLEQRMQLQLEGDAPVQRRRHQTFRTNGSWISSPSSSHTDFVCRNWSIASMPLRRPVPLSLKPPNGELKVIAR